jgi:hypothetical protein
MSIEKKNFQEENFDNFDNRATDANTDDCHLEN